jgi:hypothetical protein
VTSGASASSSSSSRDDDDIDNTALVLCHMTYADVGPEQPGICAAIREESPGPTLVCDHVELM